MSKLVNNIGLRLVVIAVIAGGAFLLRDRLSGAAASLAVGDCFDQPGAAAREVDDVQHHPCSEPHTAEVFHNFSHTGGPDAPYPSDEEWATIVFPVCDPEFSRYTGTPATPTSELTYTMFTPTRDGWDQGDRQVTCFLVRADGGPMTQSYRAASR